MRKFLYLCLMGTALASVSVAYQVLAAGSEEAALAFVKGEGMNKGEQLLSLPLRVGTNVAHGVGSAVYDGAAALGNGVVSGAQSVGSGIASGAQSVGSSLASGYNSVSNWAVNATDGLMGAPARMGQGVSDFFVNATDNLAGAPGRVGDALWSGATSAWNGTTDFFSGVGDSIASGYNSVSNWAVGATDGLMGAPARMGSAVSDFFVDATNPGGMLTPSGMWNGMTSAWNSATEGLSSAWNGATNTVSGWFSSGSSAASSFTSDPLTGSLTNWNTGLTTNFNAPFGETTSSFGGALSSGTEGATGALTYDPVTGNLTNWDTGITTNFNKPFGEASTSLEGTAAEMRQAANASEAGSVTDEAKNQAAAALVPDKATVFNVIQYAIVIMQALEGTKQEDITKDVNVKAQELQDSQGSSGGSSIGSMPGVSLTASNISSAAQAMIALLQNNPVYPDLLSDAVCLESGNSTGSGTASGETKEDRKSTTAYKQCMRRRRSVFAHTVALSAQVIAEGSNAISAEFYDRIQALASAAKGTIGTLGSMSVVNDSERFPYFEMVRGTALSAVQLEVKAAGTLSELNGLLKGESNE